MHLYLHNLPGGVWISGEEFWIKEIFSKQGNISNRHQSPNPVLSVTLFVTHLSACSAPSRFFIILASCTAFTFVYVCVLEYESDGTVWALARLKLDLFPNPLRVVPVCFFVLLFLPHPPQICCRAFQTPRPIGRGPLGEAGLEQLQAPPQPLPIRAWTHWWG